MASTLAESAGKRPHCVARSEHAILPNWASTPIKFRWARLKVRARSSVADRGDLQ